MPDIEQLVVADAQRRELAPLPSLAVQLMNASSRVSDIGNLGWALDQLRHSGSVETDRVLFSMVSIGRAISTLAEILKEDLDEAEQRCRRGP